MVFGLRKSIKKYKQKKKLKKKITPFEEEFAKVKKAKIKAKEIKIRQTAKTSARIAGAGVPKFAAKRIGTGVSKVRGFQEDIEFVKTEFEPTTKTVKKIRQRREPLFIKSKGKRLY